MEEKYGDEKSGQALFTTESKFKEFVANRCVETYTELVETFVIEAMATRRTASFPMSEEAMDNLFDENGNMRFGLAIVRDREGASYAALMTSSDMSAGDYPAAAAIVASQIITQFVFRDPQIAGIAINPWNDGGALVPKSAFLQALQRLDKKYFN